MNIFLLDKDIDINARCHCDKHVVKMVLETAQILCSALWKLEVFNERNTEKLGQQYFYFPEFGTEFRIYAPTHLNHPCVDWACDLRNWVYLRRLGRALALEYRYRYQKDHKSLEVINSLPIPEMTVAEPEWWVLCMPEEYKHFDLPVPSYRDYYISKKDKFNMVWTKREVPSWFI